MDMGTILGCMNLGICKLYGLSMHDHNPDFGINYFVISPPQ